MMLKVIDTKTGKEPTERVMDNIARKGGLMQADIDGFYVGEDGQIILVDDCGNCTWVDAERFKIKFKIGHWIILPPCFEEICQCSECGKTFKEALQFTNDLCPNCGAIMKGINK